MTPQTAPLWQKAGSFFNRQGGQLIVLALLTLSFQLAIWFLAPFPKRDALTYMDIVRHWSETGSYAWGVTHYSKFGLMIFHFLPLKWCVSAGWSLYGCAAIMMMTLSVVSTLAFYRILRILSGDGLLSFFGGLLLAANPMVLDYAGSLMRDTPYLTYSLLAVLLLLETLRRKSAWCAFGMGLTLMLALLSRYEAVETAFLVPLFGIFGMCRKGFSKREMAGFTLIALAGGLTALLLPLSVIDDWALMREHLFTILKSYYHY